MGYTYSEPIPGQTDPATATVPAQDDPFWRDALNWLGDHWPFGGGGDNVPKDIFYPQSLAGNVAFPGPFTHAGVLALLNQATQEAVESAKQVLLISDRNWYDWPPRNNFELAGALIAEAHGGRDGTPGDVPSMNVARAIRSLAPATSGTDAGGYVDWGGGTLEAGMGGILPLLIAAGVGAGLFWAMK